MQNFLNPIFLRISLVLIQPYSTRMKHRFGNNSLFGGLGFGFGSFRLGSVMFGFGIGLQLRFGFCVRCLFNAAKPAHLLNDNEVSSIYSTAIGLPTPADEISGDFFESLEIPGVSRLLPYKRPSKNV